MLKALPPLLTGGELDDTNAADGDDLPFTAFCHVLRPKTFPPAFASTAPAIGSKKPPPVTVERMPPLTIDRDYLLQSFIPQCGRDPAAKMFPRASTATPCVGEAPLFHRYRCGRLALFGARAPGVNERAGSPTRLVCFALDRICADTSE